MKTVSVNVGSLSVPCANRCRYCLLSWDGRCVGASYEECRDYAEKFHSWLRKNRPELSFQYFFGYSMDHPQLLETVDYMHKMGYNQGEFLQFDGMKFRTTDESRQLLTNLKACGVKLVDFTFYGIREYHDRFAARKGDFDYMLRLMAQAREIGLDTEAGIPLTHENAEQAEALIGTLEEYGPKKIFCFVPHGEGRGRLLDKVRFSQNDYDRLSPKVITHFNRTIYRPEGEWVTGDSLKEYTRRVLTVVPTPENLEFWKSMSGEETIAYLEKLDDDYHAAIPSADELLRQYGNPNGRQYYSQRDMIMHLQRCYIAEHNLNLYDIHDERHSFIRRF